MRFPEIPGPNPLTPGTPTSPPKSTRWFSGPGVRCSEEDISDLVREIVVTALKTQHSQLPRGDAKILSRSSAGTSVWVSGVRALSPSPESDDFRFGAHPFLRRGLQAGPGLRAENGSTGVYGDHGRGPGIMQAGNQGAGPENSFGINIRLPYEQSTNAYVDRGDRFIDCRFFFTRKLMFVKEANAVACSPAGSAPTTKGWKC
jgi:hypothetical protein